MKKYPVFFFLILITVLVLCSCQAPSGAIGESGTLVVKTTWQTEAWRPGPSGILALPDTEVRVYKFASTQVFQEGITDLLGEYHDESLPGGWYWVEAVHQPEGVLKSDYGKHWVAHWVHIKPGQETVLDFSFENAGGWTIK
jgi:hypothetical protein